MTALGSGWGKLHEELTEARELADRLALALIGHVPEASSALGGCGAYREWLRRSWSDVPTPHGRMEW